MHIDRTQIVAMHASAAALAANLAALLSQVDAEAARRAAEEPAAEKEGRSVGCKHVRTMDVSTMGKRSDMCLDCGKEILLEEAGS